jgi:single-stranded-DNA-specific exonuclease
VLVALAAVNREARKRGSIGANNLPNPLDNLDLSALGTVCDVAPLTGFNRAIVAQGLKVLRGGKNVGLAALARSAGRDGCGSVYDLGFVLGPRINAGGRIGDASLAARLLATDDPAEAEALAAELETMNAERRVREAEMLREAEAAAAAAAARGPVIVVGSPRWHPGVIGIAAGRLKDKFLKPVIVLGGADDGGPAKGSGRSLPGVNLGEAVAAARGEGLLIAGGGHAAAAGLTMDWDHVDALREFLGARLAPALAAAAGAARTLTIDAVAGVSALNLELCEAVERIGPFGQGHAEPVFALADVRIPFARLVKDAHVRFTLEDKGGARVTGIAFQAVARGFGDAMLRGEGAFHAALRLKRNDFGGRSRAEVELVDLARA